MARLLQIPPLSLVLADFLRQYDVEETDLAYTAYTYFARWMLDVVDPIDVQHTKQNPLTGIPAKNALIQMCDNDLVVPNITTQLLSERMGQSYESFSPLLSNHGFLVDPTSISGASARNQIVDFSTKTLKRSSGLSFWSVHAFNFCCFECFWTAVLEPHAHAEEVVSDANREKAANAEKRAFKHIEGENGAKPPMPS